jgi:hypothetical protein
VCTLTCADGSAGTVCPNNVLVCGRACP